MQFEGWVPNATGNLSFSAVGDSLSGQVIARQNFRHPAVRLAICAEVRRNHDAQLPGFLLSMFDRHADAPSRRPRSSRRLIYVLTCRSTAAGGDTEGALAGEIAVLSRRGALTSHAISEAKALEAALSKQMSIGHFWLEIPHPARKILLQNQWQSPPREGLKGQYKICFDSACPLHRGHGSRTNPATARTPVRSSPNPRAFSRAMTASSGRVRWCWQSRQVRLTPPSCWR
jgi:hypothetical protein